MFRIATLSLLLLSAAAAYGSEDVADASLQARLEAHVTFLAETIDMAVYQYLSTRDGGETVDKVEY